MTSASQHRSVFDYCLHDSALQDLREVVRVHETPVLSKTTSHSLGGTQCPEGDVSDDGQAEGACSLGKDTAARDVSNRMWCSACHCSFDTREEQMEHYKLDWHRFNLRQRLAGQTAVTAEEFERKTGTGDMSSISGSDSEEEEGEESDSEWAVGNTPVQNHLGVLEAEPSRGLSTRVVFQNSQGQYLVLHRCVLQNKSGLEMDMVSSLRSFSHKTVWVILMTGGGHFAGAVFQGREVLHHKTFHRYTVRAKRGTAQGLRDAKNSSHTPKSAGAALRRYNETALVKEVQDLLESWSEHLSDASAIFLRAPSYNKTMFFSGKVALLDRKDPRIRTLPFPTRRATFREIKRVHDILSTLHVYEKDSEFSDILSPKKVWKKKTPKATAEPNPDQEITSPPLEEESEGEEVQLETVEVTMGTLDLREHEIYPVRRRRRRKKEGRRTEDTELSNREAEDNGEELEDANQDRGEKNQESKRCPKSQKRQHEEEPDVWEYGLRDTLYTACKTGDLDTLTSLLQRSERRQEEGEDELKDNKTKDQGRQEVQGEMLDRGSCSPVEPAALCPVTLLNQPIDSSGFTLLHVASAAGQKAVVRLLMEAGSDPACRDKKGQTPYGVAPEKDTRNTFRKYMAEHPNRYNYSKAQVPGPLTAELESKKTEKKKAQKAAKKQREREQREERRALEMEAEEKKRFASLSDREKRALAAEKRLAEQKASTGLDLSNTRRCWQCGESLVGKVPFQYLDFSFCTPRCVQQHRKASVCP
ncbi:ankyrin repeat and zinc finger domain-containing protein 1 [Esox lucius]|uniref:VLRF1 domain-containing protein n=1 Tax=Esox lucius TaxID=8010 RepID=A0A3P8Y0Q7_ESOLU|nr:ankyrin repeat and zinc finger domain-containing protein 1 [Esox lucius]XP_034144834.1 ankyrin repeat and zinc finger domain-containing protein 1 [Esox lucius]